MHIMYTQCEQKVLVMSLEEFLVYKVPEGWKLKYVNGCEKVSFKSALPQYDGVPYFEMNVTIEKEK